jgi:lipopolysaccharide transport system permease protein
VVEGFRFSILGTEGIHEYSLISFIIIGFLFISGLLYFKKIEKVMADIV